MRFRNSRLRTKIAALLLSMTALWAFAAWVTLREGVNLLWVNTYDSQLATPSDPLLVELQRERRLTAIWLARSGQGQQAVLNDLREQRARTDKEAAALREGANSGSLRRAADDELEELVDEMLAELDKLGDQRKAIDARAIAREPAVNAYTTTIGAIFRMYEGIGTLDDEEIAQATRNLIEVNQTWEILSQEDALVAGALASGRLTQDDLTQFVRISGARRHATDRAISRLENQDEIAYRRLSSSEALAKLDSVEEQLTAASVGRGSQRLPITPEQWQAATEPALNEMRDTVQEAGQRLVGQATPVAALVIVRLVLAGGLGMLAVIASIIVSITTARALVRQLERLRDAAWELAEKRLPSVVERLGHGEKVDVAAEAPPLRFGSDEIGQVGRAFNAVQETAIRTAVEQAELRRGIRDVLLSLARRTQTLVHRQLTMLDTMERRRDIETKELEELFRLDHLATRMRRNAENLIVLSGALPARGWRNSVPMVDVVRAAVGEVEDYTRVTVLPFGPVELAGRAVGDVTHLLAELIENAVSFSPPDTVVQVGGHLVASGFAIDIEDRGLGMTDEKLAEINARIADPPDFNLQSSVQLGLFVVSKLAERYNVQVSLKRSAYGGTTAVVVIPRDLITEQPPEQPKAATTRNGLEVRRPVAAGARQGAASGPADARTSGATATLSPSSTGPQPSGPALVAVPPPEPEGPEDSAPNGRAADGGAPAQRTPAQVDAAAEGNRRPEDAASQDGGAPPTTQPEDQPPVPEMSTTPSGLPVRVPQANLVEPLRSDEPSAAEEPEEPEVPGRSPEEIQRIMGSYQRGTRQGRSDAARAERQGGRPGVNAAEGEEDQ